LEIPFAVSDLARRTFVITLVAVSVVVSFVALWELREIIGLLFLAFTLAAAMRPGIDALKRLGVPRGFGVLLHYAVLIGLVSLLIALVVPPTIDQFDAAVNDNEFGNKAEDATGLKREVLVAIQNAINHRPKADALVESGVDVTLTAFTAVIASFFVLAAAAYWIFERDRAVDTFASLISRRHRKTFRDTWTLIDLKLGAFVRGQLLLIVFVATVLAGVFFAIGLPYWLLVAVFAGVVELIPVIGPLTAGAVAVGVGFTVSVHVAVLAAIAVFTVRMLEDYIVIPRVLGDATGLSPLVVLVSVLATEALFGGAAVILAVPAAAVLVTLVDVIVRDKDPAEEEVPTVLFSGTETETGG
jgi:predicted PurR-regulated permease PerM